MTGAVFHILKPLERQCLENTKALLLAVVTNSGATPPSHPCHMVLGTMICLSSSYNVPDTERTGERTTKAYVKEHMIGFLPAVDTVDLS